ncbi:MAG: histidinol dehydrogenase [Bryobacterales bacterium]|nr:histidinol dehydrogenase [Bryobacterales bacterium]
MIRILVSEQVGKLLTRRAAQMASAEETVRPILEAVRKRGDKAVVEYARKFDGLSGPLRLANVDLVSAYKAIDPKLKAALKTAAANVREFAAIQLPKPQTISPAPGIKLSQIVRPLDCVAAYIPSGRYPLPSTLLMTVIPAQVANVPLICAASPKPDPAILGAAGLLKVSHFYQMGGAHAIAAFAYGTATVPRADRIVGPGSIWVAAAKKILAGETGIDFVAGPTEILIIANEGNPVHLAADMLAQAEHDVEASAILLTRDESLAKAVAAELDRQLETLPTAPVARKAIQKNSAIILVRNGEEAVSLSNRFAPEHLSLHDPKLLPGIRHAGSVFVGPMSPEAAGDYASGPNHVLPTSGVARFRGGLSAADYVKVISVQQLSQAGLKHLAPAITTLARAEGLEAHARSVEVRTNGR